MTSEIEGGRFRCLWLGLENPIVHEGELLAHGKVDGLAAV